MALAASAIVDRVQDVLQDSGGVWVEAELLRWLSDGQRDIALRVPAATAVETDLTLVAGVRQTLPASASRLLYVVGNGDADGSGDYRAIRLYSRVSSRFRPLLPAR